MKAKILFYGYSLLMTLLFVIGLSVVGYTAISQEVGFNLWDVTNSRWLKAPGDQTNGLDVDVTRISGNVSMIGTETPSDNYANPTDHLGTWALLGLYDGSTWDRWLLSTHGDNITTAAGANIAAINYGFDGTNYDRLRLGVIAGQLLVDNSSNAFSNISTNTSTIVKASAGILNRVHINTAGTTSTVALYNDASGACDTNYVMTIDTAALTNTINLNHTFTTGICALTAGGVAANITILYR